MKNLKTKHCQPKTKSVAQQVAEICGCTPDYVYKVLRGENSSLKIEAVHREIIRAQEAAAAKARAKIS